MKKIIIVILACMAFLSAQAQFDTIGKYPYLYHYNWPETGTIHDSVYCGVRIGGSNYFTGFIVENDSAYISSFLNGDRPDGFALYQHTDRPMEIIGLAMGWCTGGYSHIGTGEVRTSLYDSSMNELASVQGYYASNTYQTDTDAHHFFFPGLLGATLHDHVSVFDDTNVVYTPYNYVYYRFFKDPITVVGDYYIVLTSVCGPNWTVDPQFLYEYHDEPYAFNSGYRIKALSGQWSQMCWRRYVPVLFAIINPPCDPVDSVTVTVGTDGCLQADWQRPALQSSWIVRLVMPDGGEVMQPTDTNHWEYCGLAPNQHYTVYVRSRCDNLNNDYSWSDWSDGRSYVAPQAIDDIDAQAIKVTPNPTRGMVHIEAEGVRAVWLVAADGRRTQLQCKDGTVSLAAFAPGLYVLEVQTADGVYKAKVVRE